MKCCTVGTFRGRGRQSGVLSVFFVAEGHKVLYCQRLSWPRAPKCCTVASFRGWGRQSAVRSAFFVAEGAKVLYCRRFSWPGASKCCTVGVFRGRGRQSAVPVASFRGWGRQSAVLSALFVAEGHKVLYCRHFCRPKGGDPLSCFPGQQNHKSLLYEFLLFVVPEIPRNPK